MKGTSVILRRLVAGGGPRAAVARFSSVGEKLVVACAATYSTLIFVDSKASPVLLGSNFAARSPLGFQSLIQNQFRSFSSSPSSDASNIISIESKEQFIESLRKVQDESLPAIFYFTAVWCGPCRLLSPVVGRLSEKFPHVTLYKVDIDKEELGHELGKLNITSVPTLHFFQNGKKASEVIGADVQRLQDTMESLYK